MSTEQHTTTTHNVDVGGEVIYWNLSDDFDAETLKTGLVSLGLGKLCPDKRTQTAALKEALQCAVKICRIENVLIRGLENPDEDGFVVVHEQVGDADNEYQTLYHSVINPQTGLIDTTPAYLEFANAVQNEYTRCVNSVSAYAMARALVDIQDHLSGIPLRQSGGIYWLPNDRLEQWNAVIGVVKAASIGSTKVYRLRTLVDANAVEAIRDAVRRTISEEAAGISSYADRPNAKERFLRSRREEAKALHDKVKRWEGILSETLTDLHEVATTCEAHVVEVALAEFPSIWGDEIFEHAVDTPTSTSAA